MDERIKQIFHNHFDDLRESAENEQIVKAVYSYAMREIADLYAEICGISNDEAWSELYNAEKSRR